MSVIDPIADMLNRIRNAQMTGIRDVAIPYSRLNANIAQIMLREGYLDKAAAEGAGTAKTLNLTLKFFDAHTPCIRGLRRVSKPGLRQYAGAANLPRVLGGMGIAIVSTSAGILTDREAREKKIGGEVLCYVW
jgi:small subunit ribosomal protein S8